MILEDKNIGPYLMADYMSDYSKNAHYIDDLVYLISEWAEARNITAEGGATSYSQLKKLREEVTEFENATTEEEAKLEFGDILVVCVQVARLRGLNMVECLDLAYQKIKYRKGRMIDGVFVKEA